MPSFVLIADNSAATVAALQQQAGRQQQHHHHPSLVILVPHSRRAELFPGLVSALFPMVDRVLQFGAEANQAIDPAPVKHHQSNAHLDGVVTFTTGTTGPAKAVLYSWAAMRSQAEATVRAIKRDAFELVAATHIAHAYSLNAVFVAMLPQCTGLTVVPSLDELVATVSALSPLQQQQHRVLLGSPSVYSVLATSSLTSLPFDLLYSAGCPLPRDLQQRVYDRFGLVVVQNYGSTETGNIAFVGSDDLAELDREELAWCAGSTPEPDTVRLLPPLPGRLLAPGFEGDICVRSPWRSTGYVLEGGRLEPHPEWYRTSDMGRWHKGRLVVGPRLRPPFQVTDPVSGLFALLQPWQLEQVLGQTDGVKEVAVVAIGAEQAAYGAVVTVEDLAKTDPATLFSHLVLLLKPAKVVAIGTAIPRSAAGKIYYPAVEKLLL